MSDSPRECLGISNRGRIACSSCKLMLVSLPLSVLLTSPLQNCTSEGSSPGHLYLPLPSPLVIGARSAFPDAGLGVAPMSTHNQIPVHSTDLVVLYLSSWRGRLLPRTQI